MKNGQDQLKVFYACWIKKIVSFDYAGVKSNYFTFGNYHYFQNKIKCLDSNSYKKNLKKHFVVVLDKKERIKKIKNELRSFLRRMN